MNQLERSLATLTLAIAAGASHAAPLSSGLGLDQNLGLLTFGDMRTTGSVVYGSVAVGGDAALSNYSIQPTKSGPNFVVGGSLNFANGVIHGDTLIGGSYTSSWGSVFKGNVAVGGALDVSKGLSVNGTATAWGQVSGARPGIPGVTQGNGDFSLGFDFAAAQNRLTALSSNLSVYGQPAGPRDVWGTLVFDAAGLSVAVFTIDAAQASRNMRLDNLAADSTVIINVLGDSVDFGWHGYDKFAAGQVLFNLPQATSVQLGSGLTGSLLAPLATVQAGRGRVDGQVIVDSWLSSAMINPVSFSGALPSFAPPVTKLPESAELPDLVTIPAAVKVPDAVSGPVSQVPVPGSLALLLGGLVAAGAVTRRRRA